MLSYRRVTALQTALVLAKSARLELGNNLQPLWHDRPAKLSNSVKRRKIRTIRAFKVIQGHPSRYQ